MLTNINRGGDPRHYSQGPSIPLHSHGAIYSLTTQIAGRKQDNEKLTGVKEVEHH